MTFELGPGTVLGRYELLAPVAKGGMAQVWMARLHGSRGFHKLVAVKTILTKASHELRSEAMLLEEARLAALIHHPNIVTTLDLGEERELLFLVMEWVHGETLRDVFHKSLASGGMPLHLAVNVIAQACKGLHAAHEVTNSSGLPVHLVHRDISPQNLLLSYSGVVKVADFGIAKAKVTTAELTQPGELKGKVAFMSPEQLACEPVDRRSDVFAMGTLLYTVTTGHHPFRGPTTLKTFNNITACNPPKPSSVSRQYPSDLEHVVLKALAANPAQRWQTAAEMFSALVDTHHGSQGHFESAVAGYMRQVMGDKERERIDLIQRCQGASPASLRPSRPPPSPDRITLPTISVPASIRDSQPPSVESVSPTVMRVPATPPEDGPSDSTLASFIRTRHRRAALTALAIGGTLMLGFAAVKLGERPTVGSGASAALAPAEPDTARTTTVHGAFLTAAHERRPLDRNLPETPHVEASPNASFVNLRELHISAPIATPTPSLGQSKTLAPEATPSALAVELNAGRELAHARDPGTRTPVQSASGSRVYLPQELPTAPRRKRDAASTSPAESPSTGARRVDAWDRRQFGGRN